MKGYTVIKPDGTKDEHLSDFPNSYVEIDVKHATLIIIRKFVDSQKESGKVVAAYAPGEWKEVTNT